MTRRMSAFLAAACFVSASIPAFAQTDATFDPARVFTDPNYLPLEGSLYGTTGYSYGWLRGDSIDDTGARTGTDHVDSQTISQTLGYGISDDFAVILSESYVPLSHRNVDPVGAPSFDRDRSGFADPAIVAIYRALDERESPVLFDLFADYSPNLIEAHNADPDHEGTVARGGDALGFGVALGREWENFGLRGTARAQWDDTRTGGAAEGPNWARADSAWNYGFDLTSQIRFDDAMSANLGAGYDVRESFDTVREPGGDRFATHPGNVGNIHAALNYQLIPARAAASLTYQYNNYADRNVDNVTAPGESATHNRNENILGVKVDYALN